MIEIVVDDDNCTKLEDKNTDNVMWLPVLPHGQRCDDVSISLIEEKNKLVLDSQMLKSIIFYIVFLQ